MTASTSAASASGNQYGGIARFFHWAIAAMIVLQFVLAKLGDYAEDDGERLRQLALLANHKSVGMTVLLLALLRLAWRFLNPPPALPAQMSGWQRVSSQLSHWSLYVLLFALPVSGWLMSSASAYSVSWFGLFSWPDLVEPSKSLRDTLHEVHEILGEALFVIALVHIGAAFKHQWIDKDGVLKRMSSWPSLLMFVALIAIGGFVLTDTPRKQGAAAVSAPQADNAVRSDADDANAVPGDDEASVASDSDADDPTAKPAEDGAPDRAPQDNGTAITDDAPQAAASADDDAGAAATGATDDAAVAASQAADDQAATATVRPAVAQEPESEPATADDWRIIQATSYIRFTAEQAGAEFTGEWQQWQADMRFSPDALDDSRFVVTIDVKGVETRDDDRDSTLMDPEWFAAGKYPEVVFRTESIRRAGDGYESDATLEIKGKRNPITFRFDITSDGERRQLTGSAQLDRLALDVGTGEWTDTEWVGQYVDVEVQVDATVD